MTFLITPLNVHIVFKYLTLLGSGFESKGAYFQMGKTYWLLNLGR